jgi:hypothetical protein
VGKGSGDWHEWLASFVNYDYWSSTEGITDPINNAWIVNFGNNNSNDNYPFQLQPLL